MANHAVRFIETDETLACSDQHNLLQSMERLGRKGIPVGCRNGGCGVCKVKIIEGACTRRVMSRAHVSLEEEQAGYALACRIIPTSDLTVSVVGKMSRAFPSTIGVITNKAGE